MRSKHYKGTPEQRALWLKTVIACAATNASLNITVHDGEIGFVDQKSGKVVSLWTPEYKVLGEEEQT